MFFEGEEGDPAFLLSAGGYSRGSLDMLPEDARQGTPGHRYTPFSHIVITTLWYIWKARCSHVLGDSPLSIQDTLTGIWLEMVYTLQHQWDSSAGSSRAAEERRRVFLQHWSHSGTFFTLSQGQIQWHHSPPQWFLLHSSHQPP